MTNLNNRTGSYRTTREAMMAAFDRLPLHARRALADSVENWVPQPLLTRYRRGRLDEADMVRLIQAWNRAELAKREDHRSRAVSVYKGNAPDKMPLSPDDINALDSAGPPLSKTVTDEKIATNPLRSPA